MLKIYTGSVIVKREDAWIHYKCRSKEISPCKKAEISTTCSNCNQPFQDNEEKVIAPLFLLICTFIQPHRLSSSYGVTLSACTITNAPPSMSRPLQRKEKWLNISI